MQTLDTKEKVTNIVFKNVVPKSHFDGVVDYDFNDKLIKILKKYVSSDKNKENSSIKDVIDGLEDEENDLTRQTFRKGCKKLVREIGKCTSANVLYSHLQDCCNFINFPSDIHSLDLSGVDGQVEFIYQLYVHALKNYQVNLPKFYCRSLYYEALTLNYGSKIQERMFKEVADIFMDNSQKDEIACAAAMQYANLVYYKRSEEAYRYFDMAKSKLDAAYWEIGFQIEHNCLSKEIVKKVNAQICRDFNLELKNDCFPIQINGQKYMVVSGRKDHIDNFMVAFKIYYAIAQKSNFTKCLNSVGKFLLNSIPFLYHCKY